MEEIPAADPLARAVTAAIRAGDVDGLQRLLRKHRELATARIVDEQGVGRTLLHVVADWPGHFPNGARTVAALIAAGADVDAAATAPDGRPPETPLHWAASSDDVAVLDALLDGGADIEATGAVFTGGAPMSDAVIFGQWRAARRLLERGARTTLWQAAALGLVERVERLCAGPSAPTPEELTSALWHACAGGQRATAEKLLARGADPDWIGYEGRAPLDAAEEAGHEELVAWLREQGARSADELT